jgi:hypothetical protein
LFSGSCATIPALAQVEAFSGIQMQKITVQGKSYEVPVGNEQRKNDLYYLKKAMKHDQEALEIFLGGEKERLFYIGKEEPVWLSVDDKFNFKIIDVREK